MVCRTEASDVGDTCTAWFAEDISILGTTD